MPKTQINPAYSTLATIEDSEDLTPYQLLTMSANALKYFPLTRLLAVAAACAWEDITGKPATYPPETHTHAQYLESVAWSIITGKPATYPPETHTHAQYLESVAWSIITGKPETYPPETHTHSYVPLSYGMGIMHASWVGDSNATRTINLSGGIGIQTPLFMVIMSWLNASTYGLRLWSSILASGYLYVISNSGCAVDASQWTFTAGGSSIDIVANINQNSWYYRLFLLGWRTT